jgi:predicted oxidoreductase (fatty acid repression mutant protein)
MNVWKDFKTEEKTSVNQFADDNEVMEAVQSWLKATPKSFFLRRHPQAYGQVDQVCCEAGGLCRKKIAEDNVVAEVVQSFLKVTPKSFFS